VDAMNRGGGEAPLRLSTLAALGAHVGQSWNDAVGLLVLAAERGEDRARHQLRLLSRDADLVRGAATAERAPRDVWRSLAGTIDFGAWSVPPPGAALHASPDIRLFADFVPPGVGAWLIERARGKLKRALVYDPVGRRNLAAGTRTNTVAEFDLADTDLVQVLLQVRMSAACGVPVRNMEAPAVLHYEVGEEIVNHYDFVDPDTPGYAREIAERGERIITFLAYLNDDYGGGETDFPTLGLSHKGRAGDGLYFVNALPNGGGPDRRMLHAGRPPTSGEKWIVSQFIRDRAALPAVPRAGGST
ncbi:MAG TPA: 2OG-Fe(II) oxygenase, partial [Gammaproteobacteria bacterium]|nr:2OG-Fe(II) oxygenase [Gammaproteobacteria bacterium]